MKQALLPLLFKNSLLLIGGSFALILTGLFPLSSLSYAERESLLVAPAGCSKAAQILERLRKREKYLSLSEKREGFEEALELCDKMPEIHHNFGVFLSENGEADLAEEQFLKAIALDKGDEYRLALARLYLSKGDLSPAQKEFQLVLESDSQSYRALQGLAVIAEKGGDYDKAQSLLEEATEYGSDDVIIHFNLAVIYQRKGMVDEALHFYEKALKIDSQYIPALRERGILLMKRGELREGISLLEKAAKLNPPDKRVYSALGAGYERTDELDKAELAFRKALGFDDSSPILRANLALVLVKLNRPAVASELFQDLDRELALEEKLAFGLSLQGLGQYEKAKAQLKSCFQQSPNNPAVLEALVKLYEEIGDDERAELYEEKLSRVLEKKSG